MQRFHTGKVPLEFERGMEFRKMLLFARLGGGGHALYSS
jgi:hypothetical protein